MFFFMGLSGSDLALYFNKCPTTISSWINQFQKGQGLIRLKRTQFNKKFGKEKREWIIDLYKKKPVLYLDEAAYKFRKQFHIKISTSYLRPILFS